MLSEEIVYIPALLSSARLRLWPGPWSALENIPCTPAKPPYLDLPRLPNALWLSVRSGA